MKIFVNIFGNNTNFSKEDLSVHDGETCSLDVRGNVQKTFEVLNSIPVETMWNPWTKHPYIRVDVSKGESILSEDGKPIK